MSRIQTLEEWKSGRVEAELRKNGIVEEWKSDATLWKTGIVEEWSIGFKNLNKILPPLLEHLAREKKSHVITSRPLSFDPASRP